MSDQPGTLEKIVILLGRILTRASARLADDELSDTLAALGIVFPPALLQLPAVTTARNALSTAATNLPQAIDKLVAAASSGDLATIVQQGAQLRTDALTLINDFSTLPAAIDGARAAFPAITDAAFHDFADAFPRKLLDMLTADALDVVPGVGATLTLLGLVDRVRPYETSNPDLAHIELCTIRYDRIGALLGGPVDYLAGLYGWGSPQFDGTALLPALYELLAQLDLPTSYHPPSESNPPLLEAYVVDVTPTTTGSPPGLDFTIGAPFGDEIDQTVTLAAPGWTAHFTASGTFSTSVTMTLRPPLSVSIGASATLEAKAAASLVRDTGTPMILLGAAGGSRMEVKTINLGLAAAFSTAAGAAGSAPALTGAIKGGQVVIDGSQGDGLISLLLGGQKIQAAFDVAFTWSAATGLSFNGSSGLTIVLPASIDYGSFSLTNLTLLATLVGESLALGVSTAIAASLGPVAVSLSRLGFVLTLSFPAAGGNLGPAELDVAFQPPDGIGVSVDVGPVTGGGFLEYDPASGRYAGAVALSVFGVQVRAIGLLDTKLPNGQRGYSFLILVTVEFSPIELGFGITLNGVGGLCGINRDFVTDALESTLRAHNLDHVLFPVDPIKNAPAILSDLATIFPPRDGRSVFAPMFKLGWGGDLQLVTAELGVILTLPAPIVIALLGSMQVVLPRPEIKIVVLNLDVLGIIDPAQKRLSIDATLRDSRIAAFTVSGDMAMRVHWGENGGGALAIGGFNPHFDPPPDFPTLQRVAIALSSSEDLRLTAQCYLAITSNTFQIGALAELYASAGSFNIYGWLGFDALFARHPFRFVADVTAGFALREGTTTLMGISFEGELSGTSPWHAKGEAHVSLWLFDVGVSFDHTWGDAAADIEAAPIDVWPLLRDAVSDPRNWSAAVPAGVPAAVAFATPAAGPSAPPILIEPSGVLTVRERVLPLNQTLAKFGDAVPGPQNLFSLQTVALHGEDVTFTLVRDQFAPAQFEDLSDQDKLSRPSFEDRDAGFSVGGDEVAFGRQYGLGVAFNDVYLDDHGPHPAGVKYPLVLTAQLRWSASSGAAQSALVTAAVGKYVAPGAPPLVTLDAETFVVANVTDLQARADVTPPVTKGEAFLALAAHVARNPADRGQLQVVPSYEAAS